MITLEDQFKLDVVSLQLLGHLEIAAHEDVIPVRELYRNCEIAYELVAIGQGVGRVIARPFIG